MACGPARLENAVQPPEKAEWGSELRHVTGTVTRHPRNDDQDDLGALTGEGTTRDNTCNHRDLLPRESSKNLRTSVRIGWGSV